MTARCCALGFGFALAFATRRGHVLWPFVASAVRILVAAVQGRLVVASHRAGMAGLAGMVAASFIAYAATCSLIMLQRGVWRPALRR